MKERDHTGTLQDPQPFAGAGIGRGQQPTNQKPANKGSATASLGRHCWPWRGEPGFETNMLCQAASVSRRGIELKAGVEADGRECRCIGVRYEAVMKKRHCA